MIIDQSFQAFKKQDIKAVYKIQMKNEKEYFHKRIINKIIKLKKKNQHGYTMTTPLFTVRFRFRFKNRAFICH